MNSVEFIEKYRKVLTDGPDYFNPDTSMMPREKYDTAKCRILLCFGTPHVVKTVSSTAAAINDYVIEHCPDTFIDFAYMPDGKDLKLYDDNNMPYAIGHITHLDASHFDIVGFSISVLHEIVSFPVMLSTFSRCDKPIPLTWSERKDLKLGEQPIIYAGGITAVCSESMFGKLPDGRQAYVDFLYLGDCGQTNILTNRYIEACATGKVTRSQADHDVPGNPHEDLPNFEEVVSVTTIQDYIDSLFDLQEIYQPQAYEVEYNSHNQIIKNVKINPKAQDYVTPFYPHEMLPDLGIGRQIINSDGDNTGTTQTQVAEGAHVGTNWIRTDKGLVQIKDLCQSFVGSSDISGVTVDTTSGIHSLYHQFNQGLKPYKRFILKSGITIGLTNEHPVEQWHTGEVGTHFTPAGELQVGDFFMTKKSDVFGSCVFTTDEAEFLGRMLGDGSYNLYRDSRDGHNTPIHKMYLSCSWDEAEYCEDLLNRASIAYIKDENQGRHCRFWIKELDLKGRSMRDFWGFNKFYTENPGHSSIKYVPDTAFTLCEDCMKAFLKGYHDADGCTSTKDGLSKVTFDSCHESIIDVIQQFLLMVGIPTTKHFAVHHRVADEELGFYDTDTSHWYLTVSSEYFDRFNALGVLKVAQSRSVESKEHLPMSDDIRSLISAADITTEQRSHAFAAVRRGSFTKSLADKCGIAYPEGIIFDEIVSIVEDYDVVYDLSVEGVAKLTANGCSVHNCSAAGCCSFCSEGNFTGGWVEKDREQIKKEMWEAKKYSAGYKYKPYTFNMVPADTYVPVGNGKFTQIDEVFVGTPILDVYGRESECMGRLVEKHADVLNFKLSRGNDARMTTKHRQMVLTREGLVWKYADEIMVGDWIPQSVGYYKKHLAAVEFSLKAYVLGLWFGDGHRSTPEWKHDVLNFNKEETELVKFCKDNGILDHVIGSTTPSVESYVIKDEYHSYIKKIFPDYKYAEHNLNILSISELLSFTRGWFDADGCTSYNKSQSNPSRSCRIHVAFAEKSIKVARFITMVLQSVGINTHMSSPVYVKLPGYDRVYVRRDLEITGLASRQLFKKYIGFTQSDKNDKICTDKTKWSDKDKCIPGLFGEYLYSLLSSDERKGHNVSKFFHGTKGITEERFSTEFTQYDNEAVRLFNAGIRFAQVECITPVCGTVNCVDINEPSIHQFITEFGVTHNCNYLQDYKGQLADWIQIYPKVTFINMRMEELGRDVDALHMMKLIGSNRISAPMEGLSPRIQNNLLNKCLSEEALNNFMDDMVHAKMTDIKVGGIFTGFEQDEDFQWICDFVDKFKQRAAKEGGNFPFRLKCTPLVHYPLTPIEYLERKSARASYNGEHWLTDEWYEKFREHEVFFKVNGFRYSTFIEQTFVDLGRSLTPLVYKHFVSTTAPVFSLRSCATDEYLEDLRKLVDADVYFEDRDPEHYISPCHRIHIDLMGSYVPRARRLLRHKKAGDIFANEPDVRCLKTYEGAPVHCFHNCIVKEPLIIYNDVTMDEDGTLHGDSYPLNGCTRCRTNDERKKRLARDVTQSKTSEDIIATPRIPQVQKIRFVIKRLPQFDVLSPLNTSHTFVTKFLQASDELLHAYHSICNSSMDWQTAQGFRNFQYGTQIVDTMWSKNVYKTVQEIIPEVNKNLKSCQVVSAEIIMRDEKIDIDDYNIYTFESTLDRGTFVDASRLYKGEVKVESAQAQGFALTDDVDSRLFPPVFVQKGGKVVGAFAIPLKYNPTSYFRGFLGCVKKTSEQAVLESTTFNCCLTVRETRAASRDGKEKATISIATGSPLPFGKKGLCNALLMQLSK